MLDAFPLYHWFHNGNPYSGSEKGMRYLVMPGKRPDPGDPAGKKKVEYLTATVWPEPWSLEHTAEEKRLSREFEGSQQGLDEAAAWLRETYQADEARWSVIPSILDSEPDL